MDPVATYLDDLDDLNSIASDDAGIENDPLDVMDEEEERFVAEAKNVVEAVEKRKLENVEAVSALRQSPQFISLFTRIRAFEVDDPASIAENKPSASQVDEYKLVGDANAFVSTIEDELVVIDRFLRERYNARFPELSSLLAGAIDYARIVVRIGDAERLETVGMDDILPASSLIVVKVAAATTSGSILSKEMLQTVLGAAEEILGLDAHRLQVLNFVSSRMHSFAPNLSELTGSSVAAKLIGQAGGLLPLSRTTGNVIPLLGRAVRKRGFHTVTGQARGPRIMEHAGSLAECPFLATVPSHLCGKMLRQLGAKVVLAARIDYFRGAKDGEKGRSLLDDLNQKVDKLLEAPIVSKIKPLPAPIDEPKKHRAGRKLKKRRERYQQTELQKRANRVAFNVGVEDEHSIAGLERGDRVISSVGASVRATPVDERHKLKLHPRKLKELQAESGISTTMNNRLSGLSSFVSGVATQYGTAAGLELQNPQARSEEAQPKKSRYF
jgi:U4/U6 small nuclear ribonucleoprotein PRP31